jgi:hypothetical protein
MKAITVLASACISFSMLSGCVVAPDPYYGRSVYSRHLTNTAVYYHSYPTHYYYDDDYYYSPAYYPYSPYYYPAATSFSFGYYGGYGRGYRGGYRGGYHHHH